MDNAQLKSAAYRKLNDYQLRANQINKTKAIAISSAIVLLLVFTYLCIHRPTFSATHQLTGENADRAFILETKTPKGSLVTMDMKKASSVNISKGSSVTMDRVETKTANENGQASFKILPGELKSGTNEIQFTVKSPGSIKRKFHYTIEKNKLPITLEVSITDDIVNSDSIKRVAVVTDPLNTISVNHMFNKANSKTGRENFEIRNYDLINLASISPEYLTDTIETPIQVSVTDVDGQERTESYLVEVSTFTNLTVNQPEETDAESIKLSGKASPGADVFIADQNTVSNESGDFEISVPLPKIGINLFELTASRPVEKKSTRFIAVNRLAPKVELTVKTNAVNEHSLTIEGTTTPGAAVSINGQPVVVEDNQFTWLYNFPWDTSQTYTFNIKAQKPGYRNNEEQVVIPQMPVFRKPSP
ncbi:hypothetical protein [Pelotomaculum sp. PtaB.Bin117]|uniref:hypothetical protein n=1 Tax=Pelotomaculum sp. PtaB.Bin117 TaxID=1811694 RepID=UPI0009D2AC93|nr:hypothetical protein [Pelotomaculum sp. PtaB.Bin117]OPX88251.1 MAG: hypothetical protein A4E54_01358 [Pelotomaculum sp. PtaB.Bin117]